MEDKLDDLFSKLWLFLGREQLAMHGQASDQMRVVRVKEKEG